MSNTTPVFGLTIHSGPLQYQVVCATTGGTIQGSGAVVNSETAYLILATKECLPQKKKLVRPYAVYKHFKGLKRITGLEVGGFNRVTRLKVRGFNTVLRLYLNADTGPWIDKGVHTPMLQ